MSGRSASLVHQAARVLIGVLVAVTVAPVHAQDASSRAIARELFREGLSAVEAGEFERAEDRFRRALALQESAVLRYNLASTLAKRARLIEADDELARILNDPDASEEVRVPATALREEVARRFGRLTVVVQGERSGLEVLADDRVVPTEALGTPIPVDPSVFEVRASVDGRTVDSVRVLVNEGEHLHVTLTVASPETAPAVGPSAVAPSRRAPATVPPRLAAVHASEPPPRDDSASVFESPWFWVGVGVVLTGGVVTAVALSADSSEDPTMGSLGVVTVRR